MIQAWPFVVSFTDTLDYRLLVVPPIWSKEIEAFVKSPKAWEDTFGETKGPLLIAEDESSTPAYTLVYRVEQPYLFPPRFRSLVGDPSQIILGFVMQGDHSGFVLSERDYSILFDTVSNLPQTAGTSYLEEGETVSLSAIDISTDAEFGVSEGPITEMGDIPPEPAYWGSAPPTPSPPPAGHDDDGGEAVSEAPSGAVGDSEMASPEPEPEREAAAEEDPGDYQPVPPEMRPSDHVQWDGTMLEPPTESGLPLLIALGGRVTIPDRIHFGDSKTIELRFESSAITNDPPGVSVRESEGWLDVTVRMEAEIQEDSLEVELLASGFQVAGERRQTQPIKRLPMAFRWNCYFDKSGNQQFSLIFRQVTAAETTDLGSFDRTIKVVRVDHLTQQKVWMLSRLAAGIGVVSTVVGIIGGIGVL